MTLSAAAGEQHRFDSLDRCDVLDMPEEAAFDRITRIAAHIAGTPTALISLIDGDRRWFRSRFGPVARETGRDVSFCTLAVQGAVPFLVTDAARDPRFRDHPLVTGAPLLRFYLGLPLRMQDGRTIGALCVMDQVPRVPEPAQVAALADLARLAVDELELRQLACNDALTGALTRRALSGRLEAEIERSRRYGNPLSLAALEIDHFGSISDRHGHAAGDLVLQGIVSALRATLREVDVIGRMGGEAFVVVMPETAGPAALRIAERLRQTVERLRLPFGAVQLAATASFGVTPLGPLDRLARRVLCRADAAVCEARALGRNRVTFAPAA